MPSPTPNHPLPTLTFAPLVAGTPGAPLVPQLHGSAESMRCWWAQVAALANAGYRTIAPSGRNVRGAARRGASGLSGRRGMGFACRNC